MSGEQQRNGKGCAPRVQSVSDSTMDANWRRVFGCKRPSAAALAAAAADAVAASVGIIRADGESDDRLVARAAIVREYNAHRQS